MKKILFVLGAIMALLPGQSKAQGCSDAGVCTLHAFKNHDDEEGKGFKNSLSAGIAFGQGEREVNVISPYIEYNRRLGKKFSVSGRLTFQAADGELGSHAGFGDLFIIGNYSFNPGKKFVSSVFGGLKFPLHSGNAQEGNASLPMVYQSSLGTTDVILGYNFIYDNLAAAIAWQQPLSGENKNRFLPSAFPDPKAAFYLPTRQFNRKSDLLARVTYEFNLVKNKLSVQPGLLPIFHLGNDTYRDANGNRQTHFDSKDLTLNGVVFLNYAFAGRNELSFSFGSPISARDVIPDGLLRSNVLGLEYRVRF